MTPLTPDDLALMSSYQGTIEYLRRTWKSCLTATGRRQRGPTWYAIVRCDDDGALGMTSIKHPKGKRWACKTCMGFAQPIWSDNEDKCPSEDEALHEYTEWAMKLSIKSPARMQRRRIKQIYMQEGTSRGRFARTGGDS